jgi:hypothetical protein
MPFRSNSVLHFYDRTVGAPGSALLPAHAWWESLASCSRPHVFVIRPHYLDTREALEAAGLPLLFAYRHLLAFGPCQPRESR